MPYMILNDRFFVTETNGLLRGTVWVSKQQRSRFFLEGLNILLQLAVRLARNTNNLCRNKKPNYAIISVCNN